MEWLDSLTCKPYIDKVCLQQKLSVFVNGINTAVQLRSLVRFLYDSNTNYTKREASVAASGKAFDY